MIDLVVGQTDTKQTKLDLRVIHFTKGLANLVESFQFLLHKVCGEIASVDRGPEELNPSIVHPVHVSRERILHSLLHIQVKSQCRPVLLDQLKHLVHIPYVTDDYTII